MVLLRHILKSVLTSSELELYILIYTVTATNYENPNCVALNLFYILIKRLTSIEAFYHYLINLDIIFHFSTVKVMTRHTLLIHGLPDKQGTFT